MAKPGRKSWTEEIQIAQRYTDLSEHYFKVLKKHLTSGDEKQEMWAVEQLGKAFVKMIPQDVTSGGKPISINFDTAFDDSARQTETDS